MLELNLTKEQQEKEATISFIGLGNMGSAIARAISFQNKEDKTNYSIGLFDANPSQVTKLESYIEGEGTKVFTYKNISALIKNSAIVLLCVKPQILPNIYDAISTAHKDKTTFISIAAGVPLSTLSNNIESNEIVRFMPNIAAKARAAVTAVAPHKACSENHLNNSLNISKVIGQGFILSEDKFSAFIGISGSAIAYIFEFAHALALGGTREGIPYDQSTEIAFSTMESALALYKMDKENPIDMMVKVCSAGGTTIEGIKALADGNFDNTVINAVSNAAQKSRDLEK
jgi:pyrroline-5-carboxylate reductase